MSYLWNAVKWYADGPCIHDDVAFFENLLSAMDGEDCLFIRVGESEGDTEYRGNFWENLFGMRLVGGIAFG